MAKSSFEIRMDYNQAKGQANSLDEIADDLMGIADHDFSECVSEIFGNWTGSNATAYVRKCETLKRNMRDTAQQLRKTAATIRAVARKTYEAEMRAYELAKRRKY